MNDVDLLHNVMFENFKTKPVNPDTDSDPVSQNLEQNYVLVQFARDYLKERKSRRRWGIFFKLIALGYIAAVSFWYFQEDHVQHSLPHTAVIEINGVIGPAENSSEKIIKSLSNAFETESSQGIVIKINSPGGTPVQAAMINGEIHRLKALYPDKPVFVAISDICASGGYYIAVAGDQIYAHPSSIVGSIGVLINSFGLTGAMEKLGIERRLFTAGENKSMLDPFSPNQPEHNQHVQRMLNDVHQQFIDAVKRGRGNRIADNPDLFSGLIWSGEQAMKLGLIDHFGSAETIAREVIGYSRMVDYTEHPDFFERFARQASISLSSFLVSNTHSMY